MEITLHTGSDDFNRIYVDWVDHNNVKQKTTVEINVLPQYKPHILEIKINGVVIATIPSNIR